MTNIVVVQFSENVQTMMDKRYNLTCTTIGPSDSVVTSGYIGAGYGTAVAGATRYNIIKLVWDAVHAIVFCCGLSLIIGWYVGLSTFPSPGYIIILHVVSLNVIVNQSGCWYQLEAWRWYRFFLVTLLRIYYSALCMEWNTAWQPTAVWICILQSIEDSLYL